MLDDPRPLLIDGSHVNRERPAVRAEEHHLVVLVLPLELDVALGLEVGEGPMACREDSHHRETDARLAIGLEVWVRGLIAEHIELVAHWRRVALVRLSDVATT